MSRIKNKVRKSLLTATVLFMAIFLFAGPTWADDYQPGKKGSITIRLNDIGSYKGNVEFAVYQVGKPAGESNLQWQLTEKFAGCKVNLNAAEYSRGTKRGGRYSGEGGCFADSRFCRKNRQTGSSLISQS